MSQDCLNLTPYILPMEKAKITPILKPNKENKPVGNIPFYAKFLKNLMSVQSQSVLEK